MLCYTGMVYGETVVYVGGAKIQPGNNQQCYMEILKM